MDKVRFLLLLGLWAVLLPGCGKDGINEAPEYIPGQSGDIVFDIGFAPQARVSTGADFTSAWEAGDEIGVFAVAHSGTLAPEDNFIHNVKLTYDGTSWAQATPLYWLNDGTLLDFYAYYPYDENAADPTEIAFNVKVDQSAAADYSASDLLTARSDNGGNGWGKGSTVGLTFDHALSMVQLTIDDAVGALGVNEDITVTLRNVLTGCALNLGTPEVVTADGDTADITMYRVEQPDDADYNDVFTFRALVPAQTLAEGASLFHIAYRDLLLSGSDLAADVEMTAGQADMFTQEIPLWAVIQPEANSYTLRPGGRSLLIPVSQANRVLTGDGLGATATGLGDVTADNYTVELVWGDLPVGANGVIEELSAHMYEGKGYVHVKSGVTGNAVVCIKVGDVIKWSWHIWVTEPVGSATDSETGLTWMDRNLGATANTPLVNGVFDQAQWVKTLGLYYQWGRKDALPGSDGILKTGSTISYDNQVYYTPAEPGGTKADLPTTEEIDLPYMVSHPLTFVANSVYMGSLQETENNNSWGGLLGAKTIYDPCPPDWKVPPIEVAGINSWGYNNTSAWTVFVNSGRIFNGVNGTAALDHYYPASGYRTPYNGPFSRVGTLGFYWSASFNGPTTSYQLNFMGGSSSGVFPKNHNNRVFGKSIRCVAE